MGKQSLWQLPSPAARFFGGHHSTRTRDQELLYIDAKILLRPELELFSCAVRRGYWVGLLGIGLLGRVTGGMGAAKAVKPSCGWAAEGSRVFRTRAATITQTIRV